MMTQLSRPTPELVKRLTQEVEFDQRIVGLIMNPMAGGAERPLFSVKDACNFLFMDSPEQAVDINNRESVHYIDFSLLQRWLREVFGDQELAQAIGEEVSKEEFYGRQLPKVKELLAQRINQCYELA